MRHGRSENWVMTIYKSCFGKIVMASCLLSMSTVVWAQTACPQGVHPGDPRCGPSGGGGGGWDLPDSQPTARWKLTWGAIAMSVAGSGEVGTATGKSSKREAIREAIGKCEVLGGGICKSKLTYRNQCVAIAWASENGKSVGGASVVQAGPSIEVATELAIPACSAMQRGRECIIAYSNCTAPVLIYE